MDFTVPSSVWFPALAPPAALAVGNRSSHSEPEFSATAATVSHSALCQNSQQIEATAATAFSTAQDPAATAFSPTGINRIRGTQQGLSAIQATVGH